MLKKRIYVMWGNKLIDWWRVLEKKYIFNKNCHRKYFLHPLYGFLLSNPPHFKYFFDTNIVIRSFLKLIAIYTIHFFYLGRKPMVRRWNENKLELVHSKTDFNHRMFKIFSDGRLRVWSDMFMEPFYMVISIWKILKN